MSTDNQTGLSETLSETAGEVWKYALDMGLFLLVGLMLFPVFILVLTSFKSSGSIFANPLALPSEWQFQNYITAWQTGGFQHYFFNSVIVVSISLTLILVCGSLAAYALVQFDLPAKRAVVVFIIAGFMIPPQVLLVPLYTLMNWTGLLNTYAGLILTYVAFAMPFSIFLLRQFFVNIPDSYGEAARMDGCSELQVFYRVYLPLATPALAAVAIYQFVFLWNEFLYALIFITNDAKRTLPAGLMVFQGQYSGDWAAMMAGVVIAVTPTVLFFLLFQRQFVRGITMGTSKG